MCGAPALDDESRPARAQRRTSGSPIGVRQGSMRYRHVLWDWNGTVVDDVEISIETINGLLQARGLPEITVARYREVFDFPVRDYYLRLGFDLQAEDFGDLAREFITSFEARFHTCELRPGIAETLGALGERGAEHSVLSATEQGKLRTQVETLGMTSSFSALVGADNLLAAGKIARGRKLLGQLDAAPEQVVLVGDTVHDAEVADAMGIGCVLLDGGHHSTQRLQRTGAPVVTDLDALGRHLST